MSPLPKIGLLNAAYNQAASRLKLATIDKDFKAKLLEDNVIFGATLTPEQLNRKMEIWFGNGQGAVRDNPIVWCDRYAVRTKATVTLAERKITAIKPGDTSDIDNASKRKAFIIKQTDQPNDYIYEYIRDESDDQFYSRTLKNVSSITFQRQGEIIAVKYEGV